MTDSRTLAARRLPRLLTGVFITSQIVIAAYLLLALWPPTIRAATAVSGPDVQATGALATTEQSTQVYIFGSRFSTTVDGLYILLVMAAGALGSALATATSFASYVGNRTLTSSWIPWFLIRFPIGLGLPLVIYFGIQGGLLNINAGSSALNPYGIVAVAGFAGMFSKQIMDKLQEWADERFQTKGELGTAFTAMLSSEGEDFGAPRLDNIEPPQVRRGEDAKLRLWGHGFVNESTVRVTRVAEGPTKTVLAQLGPITKTMIEITIAASELQEPGQLEITVVNPDDAGGASNSSRVDVEDIEQTAADSAATNPPPGEEEGGKRRILGRLLGYVTTR